MEKTFAPLNRVNLTVFLSESKIKFIYVRVCFGTKKVVLFNSKDMLSGSKYGQLEFMTRRVWEIRL